jgi:hypothetical protein
VSSVISLFSKKGVGEINIHIISAKLLGAVVLTGESNLFKKSKSIAGMSCISPHCSVQFMYSMRWFYHVSIIMITIPLWFIVVINIARLWFLWLVYRGKKRFTQLIEHHYTQSNTYIRQQKKFWNVIAVLCVCIRVGINIFIFGVSL